MIEPIVIHGNAFVAHFYVRPDKRAEFTAQFDALWQADVEELRRSVNFVFYGWGRDPNEFVAIESWKDDAVTAAVRRSEGFQVAVGGLLALCAKPLVLDLYSGMTATRQIFADYPAGPSQVHPRAGDIHGIFA